MKRAALRAAVPWGDCSLTARLWKSDNATVKTATLSEPKVKIQTLTKSQSHSLKKYQEVKITPGLGQCSSLRPRSCPPESPWRTVTNFRNNHIYKAKRLLSGSPRGTRLTPFDKAFINAILYSSPSRLDPTTIKRYVYQGCVEECQELKTQLKTQTKDKVCRARRGLYAVAQGMGPV